MLLREIGVDCVQGYHIGKPMVVEVPQYRVQTAG